MGFRFSRRFPVLPGLRVNLSKSGASASVGRRGAWFTFGRGRPRVTVGVPGTGVSYTERSRPGSRFWWVALLAAVIIVWAYLRS